MLAQTVTETDVLAALRTVNDPEAPVSIVDLGLVENIAIDAQHITIDLVPTYGSCPAKTFLAAEARSALETTTSQYEISIRWSTKQAWSPERISPDGHLALRDFGISVAQDGKHIACPHCGSTEVRLDNQFGCAVCKSLYYCPTCRNPFEVMRGSLVMTTRSIPMGRR